MLVSMHFVIMSLNYGMGLLKSPDFHHVSILADR